MTTKKKPSSNLKTLRNKAEASLTPMPIQVEQMTMPEIQHLVHELQIHQIELEMQNEELRHAQLDLQKARDRYVDLYDFAPVGFLSLNVRGQILEANLPACQLLGVERKALLGQTFEKFVMATDQPILRQHLHNVEQKHTKDFSEVIRLKHTAFPYVVRLESQYEELGLPNLEARFRIALLDLTEQEKTKTLQKEQEILLGAIFDSAMDAIITIDEDRNIVLFNASAEQMFGVTSEEALGQTIDQFIPQRFRRAHAVHIEEFKEGQTTNRRMGSLGTVTGLRANGKEFPIEASISKVKSETGIRYTVILRDITERRTSEEALRIEQQFISTILDTAGALVVVLDPAWRILRFNLLCENLTGRNIEKMKGKFFLDFAVVSGEDAQEVKGLLRLFKRGQFPKSFESRWVDQNRQVHWIKWSHTVITDKEGKTENIIATGVDITEHKQAEQTINNLWRYNELILQSAAEGIYGIDAQGKVTFFNQAAQRLTGWKMEDVLSKCVHTLLHHSKADGTPYSLEECSICSSFKDGTVYHQVSTEVFWRQDGTCFPTEYTSTPILDEGREIKGAVITFRDISSRHRNENLMRGQKQILEMISVERSLVEIFERICRFVEELDRGSICSIFLYDGMALRIGAAPSLPVSYAEALEGMLSSPEGGSCGTAAYRKEQVIVSDIATDPLWKRYRKLASEYGLRACWSTPILSRSERVLGVLGIYHRQSQSPNATDFALMDLSCGLAGVAIERHLAREALQTKKEELQALGGQLIAAQEDERRRISRELHDDMNQRLAVLALNIQSAQKGFGTSSPINRKLQELYDGVSSLSDDVRRLAYQLHPSILDDLGLTVAMQSFVEDFSKYEGIPVAFSATDVPVSLSPEIGSCLYRVAQESLRNAARHAQCTRIEVKLFGVDGGLRLIILDNGKGFKVKEPRFGKDGLGLIGMEERMRVVQGTCEVLSASGQGTKITVWAPLLKAGLS
jgi:PAS domain S-box-containing protein